MFSFSGRLGRLAYLGHGLAAGLVMLLGLMGATLVTPRGAESFSVAGTIVVLIALIAAAWIGIAAAIKRCHDLGRSGWFILTTYIPLIGLVFSLYLLFAPGTPGRNRYGYPGNSNPHAGGLSPRELHIAQYGGR